MSLPAIAQRGQRSLSTRRADCTSVAALGACEGDTERRESVSNRHRTNASTCNSRHGVLKRKENIEPERKTQKP
jgi:hypothetical protein